MHFVLLVPSPENRVILLVPICIPKTHAHISSVPIYHPNRYTELLRVTEELFLLQVLNSYYS